MWWHWTFEFWQKKKSCFVRHWRQLLAGGMPATVGDAGADWGKALGSLCWTQTQTYFLVVSKGWVLEECADWRIKPGGQEWRMRTTGEERSGRWTRMLWVWSKMATRRRAGARRKSCWTRTAWHGSAWRISVCRVCERAVYGTLCPPAGGTSSPHIWPHSGLSQSLVSWPLG